MQWCFVSAGLAIVLVFSSCGTQPGEADTAQDVVEILPEIPVFETFEARQPTPDDPDGDDDGLLVTSGDLTLERDSNTGEVASITDGFAVLTYGYNGHGEMESVQWTFGGESKYECSTERELSGRIVKRTEVLDGDSVERTFDRDVMGQVTSVTANGEETETYQYDVLGNRSQALSPGLGQKAVDAAFGDDSRMTGQGDWSFTYDANGRVTTLTLGDGNQVTETDYSASGELRAVVLPDGTEITYKYDAFGRMAVRSVDGEVTHKYIYYDQVRPAAVLNSDDSVRSLFVYSTRNVPIYMQQGDKRFYLVCDDIGTVRMVVDDQGDVVQRIDYDAFGNVTYVLDPDFDTPFGFAGGQSDPDTGLGEKADEVKKIVEDHGLPALCAHRCVRQRH